MFSASAVPIFPELNHIRSYSGMLWGYVPSVVSELLGEKRDLWLFVLVSSPSICPICVVVAST